MVQVKLITRKDKVFLKMCLAMEKPGIIIDLFFECIVKDITKGCGRSTAYIYWIKMGQTSPCATGLRLITSINSAGHRNNCRFSCLKCDKEK